MDKLKRTSPGLPSLPKDLFYFSWSSPIGPIQAAATPSGLCRIILGKLSEAGLVQLLRKSYGSTPDRQEAPFLKFRDELERYFTENGFSFSSPIQLPGTTPFDRKVWKILTQIPYAETQSYRWVAQQIGQPKAARAVGGACGRNPLPILIPCHRVIAQSGALGGYTGGLVFKKRLLGLEKNRQGLSALRNPDAVTVLRDSTLTAKR